MSVGGGGGGGSSLVPPAGSQIVVAAGTPPQVQISYTPLSFGKLRRNKHKGTATLSVNVPGPGTLTLTGKGLVKQRSVGAFRAVKAAAKSVIAARRVKLTVRSKGKKKRKLNRTGKVAAKAKVTFTRTNGVPLTKAKRIKLVKRKP